MIYTNDMENNTNQSGSRLSERTVRVLAVLGFVAVIFVGMWGAVSLARGVPGAFSSLAAAFVSLTSVFVPANEAITVSTPSLTVTDSVPFTLSWAHEKQSTTGSYTFRYDCANGVYFTSPTASGNDATIYCNVPFNFLNANNAITLTPHSSAGRFADVSVYIDYTPNGASAPTVTGKSTVTVENDSFGASTTPTTPSTPTTPTQPTPHPVTPGPSTSQTYPISGGQVSNPNGYVDLTARIIETGLVDKTTGDFIASSSPSLSLIGDSGKYRLAVRFAVENDGTKTSPQFSFNAVLPTLPQYVFSSPIQQALSPGDRIEFTLGFDSFDTHANGQITINVDPSSSINENNKTNNIIHYTVTPTP